MFKGKRIVGALLALTLCTSSVFAVHADDIADTKKKQEALEAEKAAAESEQSQLSAQLDSIMQKMEKTQEDLTNKEAEIDEAETQLVDAKAKENDQYESMKLRIKFMYENGNFEYIEILMQANSIADLLNKAEYISKIEECDRNLLIEYENTRKEIEEREAKLKEERAELETLQAQLQEEQASVKELLSQKNIQISNLNSAITENADKLKKLIAEAEEAEKRRKEAASKAAYQSGNGNGQTVVSGSGVLSHPVPGARVTSSFGYRTAPTAGATSYHAGVDFGVGAGTPIYAADGGTVITAQYNSARGYYVVINHGNGMQTWYQHCSALYVSVGQTVTKGQNIAAVGSTGVSTGPHLHFEVHVNGTAVNPFNYL